MKTRTKSRTKNKYKRKLWKCNKQYSFGRPLAKIHKNATWANALFDFQTFFSGVDWLIVFSGKKKCRKENVSNLEIEKISNGESGRFS